MTSIQVLQMSAQRTRDSEPWLRPISCRFKPCAVTGIMGPSGCGKSTLLDLFRGRVPQAYVRGTVSATTAAAGVCLDIRLQDIGKRGRGVTQQMRTLRRLQAYVPQDDIVCPDLTVEENLRFSFRIHAAHLPAQDAAALTSKILQYVDLVAIRASMVGSVDRRGISGGQRKRVSIGMAMVTLPALLLMDEPTSGLDSTATQRLLQCCHDLAADGVTVIAILHQPRFSAFMLLDEVIFLSRFGTVFYGSPSLAILYFERGLQDKVDVNENPADAIMDILSGAQEPLARLWKTHGHRWTQACASAHPVLHEIMCDASISCNPADFRAIMPTHDGISELDVPTVVNMFRTLNVQATPTFVKQLLTEISRRYTFMAGPALLAMSPSTSTHVCRVHFDTLMRAFTHVCDTATLENKFCLVLTRIYMLGDVPDTHDLNFRSTEKAAPANMRTLLAARRFAAKLHRVKHTTKVEFFEEFGNEIILACMTAKHTDHRAVEVVVHTAAAVGGDVGKGSAEKGSLKEDLRRRLGDLIAHGMHVYLLSMRRLLSMWRSMWAFQILVPMVAAVIIGVIHGREWSLGKLPGNVVMALACLGVLSTVTHVRTFSVDRQIMSRDTQGIVSALSYFLAYNLTDFVWLIALPIVFGVPYFTLVTMRADLLYCIAACGMVCWWSSGVAYLLSTTGIALHWLNILAVFVAMIFGAFINGLTPTLADARRAGGGQVTVLSLSYNRWMMEAVVSREFEEYRRDQLNVMYGILSRVGLCHMTADQSQIAQLAYDVASRDDEFGVLQRCQEAQSTAFWAIFGLGAAFRVLAASIMVLQANLTVRRVMWKMMSYL